MGTIKKTLAVAVAAAATVLPSAAAQAGSSQAGSTEAGSASAATAKAPYCGIRWGSLAKHASAPAGMTDSITNVRAGRHACYDRLVVDGASWASVRYVKQVRQDGSGNVVPLRGGAKLEIITTRADDPDTGKSTYNPANAARIVDVTGYQTFRQAAFAGSFEGQSTLGLGVRARLPFRVFVLTSPHRAPRTVIDVAHRW